ncbi:TraB/GumN family protein [Solitalea koreensis]|uniref:Uncharacterized conserved protein YbaP, TraB family n=1 Tax=Solitalea koreensis TaxID=543615 RepID=A0A521C4S4_9SPHI|nr:TraB/GumN family protein [Solitalea koreensis]SMO53700.1 Uncharacterized conserved protein YbaP, TraB family [Solitalea koreensis]
MKKALLFVSLVSFPCLSLFAQSRLFWEIKFKNSKTPSYMLGVPMVLCPDKLVFNDFERQKLQETKQLYVQNDITRPDFIISVLSFCRLPEGVKLQDAYSDSDYAFLKSFFKDSLNLDLENPKGNYDPHVLKYMLIAHMMGCEPQSAETAVIKFAIEQNKEIHELESVREYYEHVNKVGLKGNADFLLEFVKNYDAIAKSYKRIEMDYLHPENMDSKFVFKFDDKSTEYMVNGRAEKWTQKMKKAMDEKPTFFVIPQFMLVGDNGILNSLAQMGYELKSYDKLGDIRRFVDGKKATANSIVNKNK